MYQVQDASAAVPIRIQARTGLQRLPVFRPVALKLVKLFSNDEIDVQQIAALLRSDTSLSAEVLALANSAFYASTYQVDSLSKAILILGFEKTKSLAMTVAMRSLMRAHKPTVALAKCWRHSLAAALLADELSAQYEVSKEEAYMASLMHDIGRLGLLMAYGEHYAPLLEVTYHTVDGCLESERALFEMDHCQAGLWLTQRWGFPPMFSRVAGCHHQDGTGGRGDVASLAHVACLLADALGFPAVKYDDMPPATAVVAQLPVSPWKPYRFDENKVQERIAGQIASVDIQ